MQERPELFQQLLHKTEGQRADWEYPFAVAGINLTFMLQEVVDLRDRRVGSLVTDRLPASAPGQAFLGLLQQAQDAFEQVGYQKPLAVLCTGLAPLMFSQPRHKAQMHPQATAWCSATVYVGGCYACKR